MVSEIYSGTIFALIPPNALMAAITMYNVENVRLLMFSKQNSFLVPFCSFDNP